MNYQELLKKYKILVKEVDRLKQENNRLKLKLDENQNSIRYGKNEIVDT